MKSSHFLHSSFVKTNVIDDISHETMNILVECAKRHLQGLRFPRQIITWLRHIVLRLFLSLLEALFKRAGETTLNLSKVERVHIPSMAHVHVHTAENCVYHLRTCGFGGFLVGLACRGHKN